MHRALRGRAVGLVVLLLLLSGCTLFGDEEAPSPAASATAPGAPPPTEVSVTPRAVVAEEDIEEDVASETNGQKPPKPETDDVEPELDEEPEPTPDPELDAWTIFMYMSAGAHLDGAALQAINEMEVVAPPEGVNVIVQLDRNRPQGDADEWSGARRYRIAGDDALSEINSELLEDLGSTNMGDPDNLGDFLVTGQETFPANRYALILWGDGGAWRGLVHDPSEEDDLSMADLSGGLERALADMEPARLDVIGIDGGLTAHLEILTAVQPHAQYAVVAPGLAPPGGWNYGAFLQEVQGLGELGPEQFAQLLATTALDDRATDGVLTATAAVDLQQIVAVEEALQGLCDAFLERAALSAPTIAGARQVAQVSTLNAGPDAGAFAAVDIGRFAAHVAGIAPWREAAVRAEALEEAVREAVLEGSDQEVSETGAGILLAFLTPEVVESGYEEVAVAGWAEVQRAFYEASSDGAQAAAGAIGIQGSEQFGAQSPVLLGLEARMLNADSVNLVALRQEGEANGRLVYLAPLPAGAQPEVWSGPWPDGIYQEEVVWDTTAPYISDGANGDFAPVWSVAPGVRQAMVAARYLPAEEAPAREAIMLFDESSRRLQSVWQAGTNGATPRQITPAIGDSFQLYNVFLDENRQFTYEPGVTLVYSDGTDISYDHFPLPSGEYEVGLFSQTATGGALVAARDLPIANEDLIPGYEAYLNRTYGFQFLYPLAWPEPVFDGRRATTGARQGGPALSVSVYPQGESSVTAAQLKAQTLETFGDPDVLYEEEVQLDEASGLLTAYGYEADDGPHTGIFVTVVDASRRVGYVIDIDALTLDEPETLEIMDRVVESWRFTGVRGGEWPEHWTATRAGELLVALPPAFQHRTLDNGWELFRDGDVFLALRSDDISGASRADVAAHWMDVAARGVEGYQAGEPAPFALANTIWSRVEFSYDDDDGPVSGLILATIYDGREIVAWAEGPADALSQRVDEQFLFAIAGALPDAPGSAGVLLETTFDEPGTWGIGRQEGATGEVSGGAYEMAVDVAHGFFWTAPGAELGDAHYEVEAVQTAGGFQSGYGLLIGVDTEAKSFYVFEISADGYVWIGRCEENCARAETLVGDGWFASDAVRQGLGAINELRVDARGNELAFYINDSLAGTVEDSSALVGDVGLFAETLGADDLVVQFDNLRVTAP